MLHVSNDAITWVEVNMPVGGFSFLRIVNVGGLWYLLNGKVPPLIEHLISITRL